MVVVLPFLVTGAPPNHDPAESCVVSHGSVLAPGPGRPVADCQGLGKQAGRFVARNFLSALRPDETDYVQAHRQSKRTNQADKHAV
jgi:hypothetical protein